MWVSGVVLQYINSVSSENVQLCPSLRPVKKMPQIVMVGPSLLGDL